jgi:hypothetical protein
VTVSTAKPEEKRLDGSVQTGVDQPKSRVKPASETKFVLNSSDRCPIHGTICKNGLIAAQSNYKLQDKAFYLGNVGLNNGVT